MRFTNVPIEQGPNNFNWDEFISSARIQLAHPAPVGDLPLFIGGMACTALQAKEIVMNGGVPPLVVIDPMGFGRGGRIS
jgi:hypothetical protein